MFLLGFRFIFNGKPFFKLVSIFKSINFKIFMFITTSGDRFRFLFVHSLLFYIRACDELKSNIFESTDMNEDNFSFDDLFFYW